MNTPKGARLDVEGSRERVKGLVGDAVETLEAHMNPSFGNTLTPLEESLADTVRDLGTFALNVIKRVEDDYRSQDAREEACAQERPEPVNLRWTRHTGTLWDCTAGTDLWVLEKPAGTWYLVAPSGNCTAIRVSNETDARQTAHHMIQWYHTPRSAEGDG